MIKEFEIDPQNYGIKRAPLEAIVGGSADFNASLVHDIFSNRATDAQRDIVLINSAASFVVDGKARDFQDGLEIARETIESKKAMEKLVFSDRDDSSRPTIRQSNKTGCKTIWN